MRKTGRIRAGRDISPLLQELASYTSAKEARHQLAFLVFRVALSHALVVVRWYSFVRTEMHSRLECVVQSIQGRHVDIHIEPLHQFPQ